jgi:lipopolysaccharide transport system permease protein
MQTQLAVLLQDNKMALYNWRVWVHMGVTDLTNRFAKSALGPLWIVLNLAMWVVGVGLVYAKLFNMEMREFLPFLTIGFGVWGFLVATLSEGGQAFVMAEGYIKQFTYPKQIYLLRFLVNYSLVLCVSLVAFFVVAILYERRIDFGTLWFLLGLVVLILISYAHITIMAYLTARFRDLPHGVASLMQVLFFLTPVMFTAEKLAEKGLDFIYRYNPLYYLIEIVRYPLMQAKAAPMEVYIASGIYLILISIVAFVTARSLDKRLVYIL